MFPRNKVTGVTGSHITTQTSIPRSPLAQQSRVNASFGGVNGSSAGMSSLSGNVNWNSQYQYYMTGLIPAEPGFTDSSNLALFYRDCYLFDNVAGSAVDIQSTLPFSSFDLRGLDDKELAIYTDALEQLDIQRMIPEISTSYLVDGFFCGSLVFDGQQRKFMDTLVHDALQCSLIPSPFFNQKPTIQVNTGTSTEHFLKSNSPFTKQYLSTLPRSFVRMIEQGTYILNPASTLFVARRSLTDRAYVSYLHRILPMYLIEKTMFRGTLVEAGRRQRATTHITAGDDIWTPTGEELNAYVSAFQGAEYDALGGWIATRNAVQVTDIRPGGDFWKWSDMADVLVPYKLRALGISESFLSGDASYASAESAMSVYLETALAYRNQFTHAIFDTSLFPLIAVANELYHNPAKKVRHGDISGYLANSSNRQNLKLPSLFWHKSLEPKGEDNMMDMLEKLSEKGVPIALKMWIAAAGIDEDTLLKDLSSDKELRARLQEYTGKDTSHEGEDSGATSEDELAYAGLAKNRLATTSFNSRPAFKRSILNRSWGQSGEIRGSTKTGKPKYILNQKSAQAEMNIKIAKIAKELKDPNHAAALKRRNKTILGHTSIPGAGDIRASK